MTTIQPPPLTPDDVTRRGQEIYLTELKDPLEGSHPGSYVVIEVISKKHFVDPDLVVAVQKAKKEFPDSLFFIVQIGKLQATTVKQQKDPYAWLF